MSYVHKYNVKKLAEKDPFEISQIKSISHFEKDYYYTTLISSFVQELFEKSRGFNKLKHQSLRDYVKTSYYFDGQENPRAIQYSIFNDTPKTKKGEIEVEIFDNDIYLNDRIKKVFSALKNIEEHDSVNEENIPAIAPSLEFKDDLICFSYFESEKGKYFVFEFKKGEEERKVSKSLKMQQQG